MKKRFDGASENTELLGKRLGKPSEFWEAMKKRFDKASENAEALGRPLEMA